MERRSDRSDSIRSETVADPRTSLALWLRAGRAHRGMTLDDVAKVTKIQPRILERLEAGKLDGLPADVFVRGFVRSFARCVGLDEREALRRYAACGGIVAIGEVGAVGTGDFTPTARALVEAMAELVPGSATAARATPRKMLAIDVADETTERSAMVERAERTEVVERAVAAERTEVVDRAVAAERTEVVDRAIMAERAEPVERAATAEPERAATAEPERAATAERAEPPAQARPASSAEANNTDVTDVAAPAGAIADALPAATASCLGSVAQPLAITAPSIVEMLPVVAASAAVGGSAAMQVERSRDHRDKKKKRRAKRNKRGSNDPGSLSRDRIASGTPPSASPVVAAAPDVPATWMPRMPRGSSVPWRRPGVLAPVGSSPAIVPSLVIDDADPESAERVLEERAEAVAPRRSFLPPILLDREDRTGRQGVLMLAVILLLIAATLTLSYLMRRPSGDGMTRSPVAIDAAWG